MEEEKSVRRKVYRFGFKPYFVWVTYVPYLGVVPKQRWSKVSGGNVELDFTSKRWLDEDGRIHDVEKCGCGMCATWESWLTEYYALGKDGIYLRRNKWP